MGMDGTSFSSWRHDRPTFKRLRITPEQYLANERIRLLRDLLTPEHALRNRVRRHTGAIIIERSMTGVPREAFTDEELRTLKLKRRTNASDQNEARIHLQDTTLVNMWNTDCQTEEQWAEYDSVQPLMEISMINSSRPAQAFHPDLVVGAKRKRVVSGEKRLVRAKSVDRDGLEDGEIEETQNAAQSIEDANNELRLENEAIIAFLKSKGLDGEPYRYREPSPPDSEKTDSSGDESDLDVEIDEDVGNLQEFDVPDEDQQ